MSTLPELGLHMNLWFLPMTMIVSLLCALHKSLNVYALSLRLLTLPGLNFALHYACMLF